MQLTEKSKRFASKLLKHYPITQQSKCEQQCKHHQPQNFQPFQHMHDHRKEREIYDKPTSQKLQNMRYFKQMGNTCFKEKKYNQAVYFYHKAILYSDYTFPQQEIQIKQMEVLVQQSNMNMAICLIKENKWTQVLVYLREATKAEQAEQDTKLRKTVLNTKKKAYYWMAKYHIRGGHFQNANQQIQLLGKLDDQVSSKQQMEQLKRQVSEEMKKYDKNLGNMSKKMISINS